MRLLLKGARVIDPAAGVDGARDILIEDGLIAAVGHDAAHHVAFGEDPADLVACAPDDHRSHALLRHQRGDSGHGGVRRGSDPDPAGR